MVGIDGIDGVFPFECLTVKELIVTGQIAIHTRTRTRSYPDVQKNLLVITSLLSLVM